MISALNKQHWCRIQRPRLEYGQFGQNLKHWKVPHTACMEGRVAIPGWICRGGGKRIARMAVLNKLLQSVGLGKTPEEIAEERIEAARKSKATELDLSELGLTELPDSIGQLVQLRGLNVLENRLTALPEYIIGQLGQLQSLNVSNNQLPALPESIGQLTQLRKLRAFGNQLTALPEGVVP